MNMDIFSNYRGYCSRLVLIITALLLAVTGCAAGLSESPPPVPFSSPSPQPDISDIQANGITSSSAVITWTAGKPLTGLIEWGKTTEYEFDQPVSGQPGTQQPVMLSGLKSNTTYHYRFNLKAQNGDPVTSADQNFTTIEQISGSTLALSRIGLARITDVKATIAWSSDVPATGQVEYGKNTSYGSTTAVDGSYVKDHLIELTQLSPNTVYHYRVISRNKSGSETVSMDQSFTTADPSDKTAPVISYIEVLDITYESATVTWVTNELATGQVEYSTDLTYVNIIPSDGTMGYKHIAVIEDLDKSKTYHFRIKSADWTGNASVSPDETFVTDSGPRVLGNRATQHTHCKCSTVW